MKLGTVKNHAIRGNPNFNILFSCNPQYQHGRANFEMDVTLMRERDDSVVKVAQLFLDNKIIIWRSHKSIYFLV